MCNGAEFNIFPLCIVYSNPAWKTLIVVYTFTMYASVIQLLCVDLAAATHMDDEYVWAGVEDPKIVVTTSHNPSSRLKQFAKVCSPLQMELDSSCPLWHRTPLLLGLHLGLWLPQVSPEHLQPTRPVFGNSECVHSWEN